MSRFPAIPNETLTGAQKLIEGHVEDVFTRVPSQVEWKAPSGVIMGPYSSLYYTDDLVEPWFRLAFAITRQQRFTTREKELAILAVLAEFHVPYVLYAHSQIAVAAGLSKQQVQQAVSGSIPVGLDDKEKMVYQLALHLARLRRPMETEVFEQARAVLGRDRVAGLAHLVSGFIYVGIMTNISDGDVPQLKDSNLL